MGVEGWGDWECVCGVGSRQKLFKGRRKKGRRCRPAVHLTWRNPVSKSQSEAPHPRAPPRTPAGVTPSSFICSCLQSRRADKRLQLSSERPIATAWAPRSLIMKCVIKLSSTARKHCKAWKALRPSFPPPTSKQARTQEARRSGCSSSSARSAPPCVSAVASVPSCCERRPRCLHVDRGVSRE